MRMVVEWEDGGWETDDRVDVCVDLDQEVEELKEALDEAGDPEDYKVRFSGGRSCTREVLDLLMEQYGEKWTAPGILKVMNYLLMDGSGVFARHIFVVYALETWPNEFTDAEEFFYRFTEEVALSAGASMDPVVALIEVYRPVTTVIDDYVREAAGHYNIFGGEFNLWDFIDFEKMVEHNLVPRVHREWEGRHVYAERQMNLKTLGLKPR